MKTFLDVTKAAGHLRGCGVSTPSPTGRFLTGAPRATFRVGDGALAAGPGVAMARFLAPSAGLYGYRKQHNNSKTRIADGASGSHPDWDPV